MQQIDVVLDPPREVHLGGVEGSRSWEYICLYSTN